ncbi:MAG: DUF1501 domain-containing protein [Pirellulales bacterium]
MLARCANGFGAVALAALMSEWTGDSALSAETTAGSQAGTRPAATGALASLHHPPRAKNVIFLYMDGGPSQMDTFDPKPLLNKEHGRPFKMTIEPTQFNNNGSTFGCPWKFTQYGQSGIPVSELFPHVAQCVDDLAVVRSMTSNFSEHTTANYFLHTGSGLQGRPSMGAWFGYGLGSECRDLPGFVVLHGGLMPPGGIDCFGSGFLPATFQGSIFKPEGESIANVRSREKTGAVARNKRALLRQLDEAFLTRAGNADAVESAITNAELAFRMQAAVPELVDLSHETVATKKLYGIDAAYEQTRIFAAECLLARRLVERGVRFVELTCPQISGEDRWDAHSALKSNHESNARAVDQPIAGLLRDLKSRGLLDTTLVVWAGEFGRTPFAQGSNGRDHDPFAFSIWLAGGGIRGGTIYGRTDEYGYKVVENKLTVHDLHATMLHLLGVDHKRLTFRFSGRDMRLTDVHGEVVREILV